jgi:hypothetical protein
MGVKHPQMTGKFVDEILDVASEKSVRLSRPAATSALLIALGSRRTHAVGKDDVVELHIRRFALRNFCKAKANPRGVLRSRWL